MVGAEERRGDEKTKRSARESSADEAQLRSEKAMTPTAPDDAWCLEATGCPAMGDSRDVTHALCAM